MGVAFGVCALAGLSHEQSCLGQNTVTTINLLHSVAPVNPPCVNIHNSNTNSWQDSPPRGRRPRERAGEHAGKEHDEHEHFPAVDGWVE